MPTVIVGAGRIGSSVLEMAIEADIDLTVIEREPKRAHELDSSDNFRVINDDATERDTLHKAQVDGANAIIATTEEDATNLMVLMLARDMGCQTLVSVVHEETNIPLFEQLGATIIENPQRLIAEYLFRGIQDPGIQDFMHVGDADSDAEVFELVVEEGAPIIGKTLEEADVAGLLPPSMIVVAVERDGEVIIPRGHTRVEPGDFITIFSKDGISQEVTSPFGPHAGSISEGDDFGE
ncbi:TrkA domain-containing protein [Natrinema pellirubrum DSM 15624]|uniref:K+ transport system, NAD-binding component n=1 Tax=Natrinema pellirubrum (strain DSM 15624 / CIP 106293 / JCM 10476 / NCIMB 786 / 157) TaxID=797303 RepID=L0JMY5_NATP1|nr:TrkA family potassium uptake protein [Natrinema pellirubrum]AGB31736.1 K+ transport system, NAD-binding component [Natrinema pellirubrum DSM 15624]ELY72770.1 TrkA domain-containing protein [Natrinema pellirubrum DSM 15624]